MKITIEVKAEAIILSLLNKEMVVDNIIWDGKFNLSEGLLSGIDDILKRNKLQIVDIVDFEVVSEISDKFTSIKIAQIVAKTLKFAQTVD
jgi:tRNA A37 threonylcarbamoyladenosine modification protein TsaB